MNGIRVGFQMNNSGRRSNGVLIAIVNIYALNCCLPNSRCDKFTFICVIIPRIKVADNRNSRCVGCPDSERKLVLINFMIAEKLICFIIRSVMEKIYGKLIFFLNFRHKNLLFYSVYTDRRTIYAQ